MGLGFEHHQIPWFIHGFPWFFHESPRPGRKKNAFPLGLSVQILSILLSPPSPPGGFLDDFHGSFAAALRRNRAAPEATAGDHQGGGGRSAGGMGWLGRGGWGAFSSSFFVFWLRKPTFRWLGGDGWWFFKRFLTLGTWLILAFF